MREHKKDEARVFSLNEQEKICMNFYTNTQLKHKQKCLCCEDEGALEGCTEEDV